MPPTRLTATRLNSCTGGAALKGAPLASSKLGPLKTLTHSFDPDQPAIHRYKPANNAGKSTLAKLSAGTARRLLAIKSGAVGQRKVEILRLPYLGTATQSKRKTTSGLVCAQCSAISGSPNLGKIPFHPAQPIRNSIRSTFVKRLRKAHATDDHARTRLASPACFISSTAAAALTRSPESSVGILSLLHGRSLPHGRRASCARTARRRRSPWRGSGSPRAHLQRSGPARRDTTTSSACLASLSPLQELRVTS